jgi:hypothetical protein
MELSRTLIVAFLFAGCGDAVDDQCRYGARTDGCYAAMYFAARDSQDLVPPQSQVNEYFDRWRRVIEAEPVLTSRLPQRYRTDPSAPLIYTRNQRVIAAWSEGTIHTGDAGFDALVTELEPQMLNPFWRDLGDGSFYFSLVVQVIFNEEVLHTRLLAVDSWLSDAAQRPRDDGTWSWDAVDRNAATANIVFTFGWGDCLVVCDGFRTLRAVVPADSVATVYDLGGDPLPPQIELSPNTIPPP